MVKNFIFFAVLIGIVSSETVKESLLTKLHNSQSKLTEAIESSINHGFNLHKSLYQSLLKELSEHEKIVQALKNETQQSEIPKIIETINKFEKTVITKYYKPSIEETAKANGIYLAAGKSLNNDPKDRKFSTLLFSHVQTIIREENSLDFSPITAHTSILLRLSTLYNELNIAFYNEKNVTFQEFYDLANSTRALIVSYRENQLFTEAKNLQTHLESFDQMTLQMARSWPIKTEKAAQSYMDLAQNHNFHRMAMAAAKPVEKPLKHRLLWQTEEAAEKVKQAEKTLKMTAQNYFAERMRNLGEYIQKVLSEVKQLPVDATELSASHTKQNVATMMTIVESELKDNAPEEKIKSKALYLAAIASFNSSIPSAAELKTDVTKLIETEKSHLAYTPTVAQRSALIYFADVKQSVQKLEKKLENFHVPTPEENRDLENEAWRKFSLTKPSVGIIVGQTVPKFQTEIFAFRDNSWLLNKLLPIDSADKIEKFIAAAGKHHLSAMKIHEYLGH